MRQHTHAHVLPGLHPGAPSEVCILGSEVPGFEALGGMPSVVQALREMALTPLLYPELFSKLHIAPPRYASRTLGSPGHVSGGF